jgi:rhamnosyltransferase
MIYNFIDIAVVTLFNPQDDVLDNIRSYLPYVKELLVIDNSEVPYDLSILKKEFNVTVFCFYKNLGISEALNLALKYAEKKEYKWLLTMDQDSYFNSEEIIRFITVFKKISHDNLAIFSPLHNDKRVKKNHIINSSENFVMTSGNIINIQKSLNIGGFDERLFIDEVDHDFCLRLKKEKYTIIQNQNCYLNHTLGEKCSLSKKTRYSSKRLYYMSRNYLFLRERHREYFPTFFKERDKYLLKFFIKQILYSSKKKEFIKMLYLGIKDYKKNNMGYRVIM